ncbi:M48 family metalloprotease [Falsiroseomonas sp. HC035]|uniref:M48 family metalloprotease n=1 Tax=Falsiroseomonas sp. HC035 TaxID=3390999 RepID=UPI003D311CD3
MQAVGLRTHAWNTAIRSILLLAGFPVLLGAMGYALALLLVAGQAPDIGSGLTMAAELLPAIIPLALLLAGIWFAIAWFAHRRILDLVTGAKRVTEPKQEPRLWRLTEALCISRGMRLPRLSVIETPARNAFAAGMTADRSAVTVTRGLLDALDDAELSAVLAHELAHIRNGDARLGVVAAVFVGVITLVTDGAWQMLKLMRFGRVGGIRRGRSSSSSSSSRSGGRGGGGGALVVVALIAIAILIAVLAHLLAVVLRMALSRNREYLADAGAVEMTGNADAMISALRKVAQRPDLPAVPDQVRALFLHDAVLSRGWSWFATHPPMEDRVAALVRYGGGRDPGPLPPIAAEAPAPLSPPASPSGDVPRSPASSPPANPWHRSPPGPPAPG